MEEAEVPRQAIQRQGQERPKINDRITVVECIYYQPISESITAVESRFVREVRQSEQPYVRRYKVGEEWKPLDLGWLKDVNIGMLVLINEEGKSLQKQPTEEERAELAQRIVEIGYGDAGGVWRVPPGESFRGTPVTPHALYLRCLHGTAAITLHIFPA